MNKALLVLVSIAVSFLAGCAGGEEPKKEENKLSIGLIYSTGGRGDQGINDLMYEAVERVATAQGWEYNDLENETASNVEPATRLLCEEGRDVIINFGFGSIAVINKLAREYPEIKFITIDAVTDPLPNVVNFTFREEQGSFLVGVIAGLMTKTNSVGFVGGMENDMIKRFNAGFAHGVVTANPEATVNSGYCGATVKAFADPTTAKEIALSFYDSGSDIIFAAAGGSGLGVFEAAIQKGLKAIGVDSNQQPLAPENMLTSMLKRVDVAIETALTQIADGNFQSGHFVLGVDEGGVDYVNDKTNVGMLPTDVIAAVEEYREKIRNGEIEVRSTM